MTATYSAGRQCGKVPYDTKADAKRARARSQTVYGGRDRYGRAWTVYRCPHCDAWHIGHEPFHAKGEQ